MKKYFIAVLTGIIISAGLAFGYLFIEKDFYLPSEASSSQEKIGYALQTSSFQGKLADSLEEIGRISSTATQKISESFPNIFENKTSNPGQAENNSSGKNSLSKIALFSFAVIGDTQNFNVENQNGYFQQVVKSIRKLNPNFVIAVGDLQGKCSGGKNCKRDYRYWEDIMGDLAPKTYAVQGNHDRIGGPEADKIWRSAFDFPTNGPAELSEITYFFDFENTRFIVLASDNPEIHLIDARQRTWLENNLAGNKKENTFVFFHEPAYPAYGKVGGSLDNHPSERDALWQIFDKYNVSVVFNGHEHIATRRLVDSTIFQNAKNSIYQFVFGNTDSFDHALPDPGVAEFSDQGQGRFGLVKINGKEITVETHGPDGALLNSFTFSK